MKKILFFLLLSCFFSNTGVAFSSELHIYINNEYLSDRKIEIFIKEIIFRNVKNKNFRFKIKKRISSFAKFNQNFLASVNIPQGYYSFLTIKIGKVIINSNKDSLFKSEITIPVNLKIEKNSSKCFFIVWNVAPSFAGKRFLPRFFGQLQKIPLRSELLFAISDKADSLYLIRTDLNQVAASMKIEGNPQEMHVSCNGEKIYILSEKTKKINVVDVASLKIIDSFYVPFVIEPKYLIAVEKNLFIVDSAYNKIVKINMMSGGLINKITIGDKLTDIVYYKRNSEIFVSSFNNQKIYKLDENLSMLASLDTSGNPVALYTDEESLYISNRNADIVNVVNPTTGEFEKDISVISPRYMIKFNKRLYISNNKKREIDIVFDGLSAVNKKIFLPNPSGKLTVFPERGWLYTIMKKYNKIAVIDALNEKFIGEIEIGAKITDIKISENATQNSCE